MSRFLTITVAILLLVACTSVPQPTSPRQVPLGSGLFNLYPGAPGSAMYSLHQITWRGQEERQLLLHLEEYPDRIQLAGLTVGGQALFEAQLRPGELSVDGVEQFSDPQQMAMMLAQMQISRLPEAQVRAQLQGLRLEVSAHERRLVDMDGKRVLRVRYRDDETIVEHADYQVQVRLLEEEAL